MNNNKKLFTAGQFAKLHNINKRTLHYYDDIELFSPAHKGENEYRYYTYLQSTTLEMILTLRELNMSIEEISNYIKKPSAIAFKQIIENKTVEIDENIKRLKDMRKLLINKESQLTYCESIDLNSIELIESPKEYLLLSKSITGAHEEDELAVLVEHAETLSGHRRFNKCYGSMISVEKIMTGNFDDYDCFFTKIDKPSRKAKLFIKPSGSYIRAFCKGTWDKLPDTYCRIIDFASKNDIKLKGHAFEEGINEIVIASMDDYVTLIDIPCEKLR